MHNSTTWAAIFLVSALYLVVRRRKSAIRNIPAPESPSWIFGHMRQLMLSRYGDHEFRWLKQYGAIYRLTGCFGQQRLMVADPAALHHILNSSTFNRSPAVDNTAELMFGEESVLTAKAHEHRRLRSALNVGFTPSAVRKYHHIFKKTAEMIAEDFESHSKTTDVCPILSFATLNVISEAILGHSTADLPEEFVDSTLQIVELSATQSEAHILLDAIGSQVPRWLWRAAVFLPTNAFKIVRKERYYARKLGGQLVEEKREAARKGLELNDDFFSVLVNPDNLDNSKALSTEDIIAQTALILIAGQETTANTLAFGLMELARHPDFQHQLRTEIYSTAETSAKNAAYDSMPLLNAFLKEILRLYPAVPLLDRVATQDTVLPLSESVTTLTGERVNQIAIQKGQIVTMAIASYQRLSSHWGPKADKFKPSRWLEGEVSPGDAVGPYANLLSFMGGPRTCLGWRFALLEMQVIVCELVGKFSFEEPENEPIQPRFRTTLVPITSTGEQALPLCVTRIL
ncbi:cytochrome P450 [Mycena polygramma]|nr:cytochrome P450 [Mycena polygramma]